VKSRESALPKLDKPMKFKPVKKQKDGWDREHALFGQNDYIGKIFLLKFVYFHRCACIHNHDSPSTFINYLLVLNVKLYHIYENKQILREKSCLCNHFVQTKHNGSKHHNPNPCMNIENLYLLF
jgi:hypothetical protein